MLDPATDTQAMLAALARPQVLKFIEHCTKTGHVPFTTSDLMAAVEKEIGECTPTQRKRLNSVCTHRLKTLVALGCLTVTKNPLPQANAYELTAAGLNVLTDPHVGDPIAALTHHFNIPVWSASRPFPPRRKPLVRRNDALAGKTAGITKIAHLRRAATAGMPSNPEPGKLRCELNGVVFYATPQELYELNKLRNGSGTATPKKSKSQVLSFRETLAAGVHGLTGGFRHTLEELEAAAAKSGKPVTFRNYSAALSQLCRVMSGIKYFIHYHLVSIAGELTSENTGAEVAMPPSAFAAIRAFCDRLDAAADDQKQHSNKKIVLPTLSAPNPDNKYTDERVPCAIRLQGVVEWEHLGEVLPEHLRQVVRVNRKHKKSKLA